MIHPEKKGQLSLRDLFPEAITAQSAKIVEGDEELVDQTPTRRCIAFVCSDGKRIAEVHLNNGDTDPSTYASRAISRLKEFYGNKFKVIVVGGDELISQNYVDEILAQIQADDQIVFDRSHSDTGGVWVRHVTATPEGAKLTRTKRTWGEPEDLIIKFPEEEEQS